MKRDTYVHFGDTPHWAVLKIHSYCLFSKWCVIDLHLRTNKRIYSVKKNLFSKPSRAHHIFSIRRFFFQNCSGHKVVQQSSLFYRFTVTKISSLHTAVFLSGNYIFICKKIKIKIYYKKMFFRMTCRHFLKNFNV